MRWLKDNWTLLIVGLLVFVIFFNRNPFGCGQPLQPTRDTVVTVTKSVDPQPPVYIPMYIPSAPTSSTRPIVIPPQYTPSGDYEKLLKQYNELAQKHLTTNTYNDSLILRDSTGQRVGVVNINDQVKENTLANRKLDYQLSVQRITKEQIITVTNPPKTQVYYGGAIGLSPTNPVQSIRGSIMLKNRRDQIYEVYGEALRINSSVYPMVGVGTHWKF